MPVYPTSKVPRKLLPTEVITILSYVLLPSRNRIKFTFFLLLSIPSLNKLPIQLLLGNASVGCEQFCSDCCNTRLRGKMEKTDAHE
jgi:hypothetical protein